MVVTPRNIPVSRASSKPAEGRKPNFRGRVRRRLLGRRRRAAATRTLAQRLGIEAVVDRLVDPSVTVPAITGRAASWGDPMDSPGPGGGG